jgi:hypothetical protein
MHKPQLLKFMLRTACLGLSKGGADKIELPRCKVEHGPMMLAPTDAQFVRIAKLAALAGAIGSCLAGSLFFLDGALRVMTASAVAGLAVAVAASLVDAYWRRGPADVSRAGVEKKARWARAAVTIAVPLGFVLSIAARAFHAEWLVGGFIVGLLFFLGLMLSPFFRAAPKRRAAPSAVSRMTSMERAARTPYE